MDEHFLSDEDIERSVQNFINRTVYRKFTKKIIDSIPDNDLNLAIFDSISINMGGDNRSEAEIVKGLSKGQQAVYSIWIVESEVNNGGYNQLYFNGNEEISIIAETGFATIGAQKFAELTHRANELFRKILPELEKYNDGTIESFSESYDDNPLNDLDDEFFELYKIEVPTELVVKYIRNHIDEFIN